MAHLHFLSGTLCKKKVYICSAVFQRPVSVVVEAAVVVVVVVVVVEVVVPGPTCNP